MGTQVYCLYMQVMCLFIIVLLKCGFFNTRFKLLIVMGFLIFGIVNCVYLFIKNENWI